MPDEQAADAAKLVREMTHDLRTGREFLVTPQHHELVAAIRDFATLMDAHVATTTPLSRQQRRAQQRRKRKK